MGQWVEVMLEIAEAYNEGRMLREIEEKAKRNKALGLPLTQLEEYCIGTRAGLRQLKELQQIKVIEDQQRQLISQVLELEKSKPPIKQIPKKKRL